ncbi:MAG: LamG domain-containing protein, partial [Bacteroidaceae bacterium]|nr:LamG domain-containing protein [Bacteroidaceae bacterium]
MKKLLLMLALVLPCLGAWAQTPVLTYENITAPQELSADEIEKINKSSMTIIADVEITNSSNWSLLFSAVADYTSSQTVNNTIWGLGIGGNSLRYYVGPRDGGWYSSSSGDVSTSSKQLAFTYDGTTIKRYVDGIEKTSVNSTKGLDTFNGTNAKFYIGGVVYNTDTEWGVFNGNIKSIKIYNSVLTNDQISEMFYPEGTVLTTEDFVNGKVYTFQTSIGWMGAREADSYAISTALASNNTTGSAEDPYFQWTVYKSDKGNFYIYNVGKAMFLGEQSTAGNASVPMSDTPAKVTFKATTKGGYPLMFKTTDNESCVINHSIRYGTGLITWNGGWSDTNDNGNCHLIKMIDDLDANVLATIKSTIDAYEADNTEAVAELDATITKAQTLFEQITIGTGIGEYTATNANYMADFGAIVAFRQAIQATNNPTPEAVKAKTAELEALIASFSLNMPEAGKFYTFKNETYYITSEETSGGRIALSETKDATAIYYFDGTHLLAYTTGKYFGLNTSDWTFEAVGSTDISTITFVAADNGAIAKYNINSGGRWLHRTDAYVNRCTSNTCGNAHNWSIEEVTSLPVTISAAGYATFYAPVAVQVEGITANTVTINGKWATLTAIEDGIVPAETGVILNGDPGTYNLTITETEATIESGLEGTI